MQLLTLLTGIVTDVLLPILPGVGVGTFVRGALVRWHLRLDVGTFSGLDLWVFSRALIFDEADRSTIPLSPAVLHYCLWVLR